VTFAWPLALVLLVVPLALLAAYWWMLRRRRKQAVRYSSVALLRSVLPRRSRWQRHLPVALLLASLVVLAFAAARPHVEREVPIARTSVVLALDVSGSMCATDVEPNRLSVAQDAAREFVEDQPDDVRLALVVFSGFAQLAVPPTRDRKVLAGAIDSLTIGRGTAIGAAMLKGIDAIAEVNPQVAPVGDFPEPASTEAKPGSGGYVPDIIVLLTDGASNRGIEPLDAVPYAVERGIRVYTIGFGTVNPTDRSCTAEQLGLGGDAGAFGGGGFGGGFGFGGGGGFGFRGRADLPTLRAVANRTGGTFHNAEDADQLRRVFDELPKDFATQKEPTEITWMLVALGAVLAAAAMAASIRWAPHP
jgi:Ca-activated chloride channel family protein